MTELHTLSATALAQEFAARTLSPVAVAQDVIGPIERCEPRWLRGAPLSPLDGAPGTLKENLTSRGCAMPGGTAASDLSPLDRDSRGAMPNRPMAGDPRLAG